MTQTKAELLQTRHQGDLKLGDADSSHYVGFKAPATVGTSLVWTLPAADGSANQFLQTNASGVLGWGTADVSSAMPLSGGTFTGNTIYNDNVKAIFGTASDGVEIFHNGSNSYIKDSGTGNLVIQSNYVDITNAAGNEDIAKFISDGAVELYHNAVKKFETSAAGVTITGALTVSTNATITGDLTVSGTTTTINTQTLDVEDKNVVIGKVSSPSDTTADGGGWTLKGATDKTFNWVNSTDAWTSSEHIVLAANKRLLIGTTTEGAVAGDNLTIEDSGNCGITIRSGTSDNGLIYFSDGTSGADEYRGYIQYTHGSANEMYFGSNGVTALTLNNSQNAIFAGTVTATSFSGSGANLTNLPAGGNSVDLVADGAIAAGKPCIIKTNGKAQQVQTTNTATGPQSFSEYIPNSGYSPTSLKIAQALGTQWAVMVYANSNNPANIRLKAYNWATGSAGGEYTLTNGQGFDPSGRLSGLFYCTTRNKFVFSWVAYHTGTSNSQFCTFDISNSDGSLSNFTRTEVGAKKVHDIEYAGGGKFFSCFRLNSNDAARIQGPHTINSNGSITLSTSDLDFIAWNDSPSTHIAKLRFNSDYSKFVVGYVKNSNNIVYARVGTWNGSGGAGSGAMSLGSELNISSSGAGGMDWQSGFDLCCEKTSGKWVAVYGFGSGSKAKCISSTSGTNIAAGSELSINSTNPDGRFAVTDNGTVENVVTWGGKYSGGFGCANLTISGTNTLSVAGGPNQVNSNGPENYSVSMYSCVDGIPDSGSDNVLLFNRREGSSNPRAYRATVAAAGSNFTGKNFLGFANSAVNDGATGTFVTDGNIATGQSGLTIGTRYYVSNAGGLQTSQHSYYAGGLAIAADKIIIRTGNS